MGINIQCGKRLKECRMAAGLTQREFAELVNYSAQQICYIENGKRALSKEAASIFAEKLGVRADYLLCVDNIKFSHEKTMEQIRKGRRLYCLEDILFRSDYYYLMYEIHKAKNDLGEKSENLLFELNKDYILKSQNKDLFYCSNELLNELLDDILNYATMRVEKWLLPKCRKPSNDELNAARLTPDGEYMDKITTFHFDSVPFPDFALKNITIHDIENEHNKEYDE